MLINARHAIYGLVFCATALSCADNISFAQSFAAQINAPWIEDDLSPVGAAKPAIKEFTEIEPLPLSLSDLEKMGIGHKDQAGFTPATAIEAMYSDRADTRLNMFGYDLFDKSVSTADKIPAGRVNDDYILSTGDKLEIVVRGQSSDRKIYEINSRGELLTDHFSTLNASGRTLGDIRNTLMDEASRLHNLEINVSLAAPRQIDVMVIGDAVRPGRKTLTPFHSVLDALQSAGGIKKTGSLRGIKLVRAGQSTPVDLYTVMLHGGAAADKNLRDGDRIIVPPIGPTVAISGAVKRAGIYDIKRGEHLSALEMLGLAGGVLTPGSNRFMRQYVTGSGDEIIETVDEPGKKIFGDGHILNVAQATTRRGGNVELSGHARDKGQHDLKKARSLADLIRSENSVGESLYPLLGVIERRDPKIMTRTLIEFSPAQILHGKADISLAEGDSVKLFSMEQIRNVGANIAREPLLHAASYGSAEKDAITDPALISFLEERAAFVRGAVRHPGAYPVADGTSLEILMAAAGGTSVEADSDNIEITTRLVSIDNADAASRQKMSLAHAYAMNTHIAPGDTVRVNRKFNRVEEQSVMLLGEVINPGRYDLVAGDTLLSLLQRAGGLSDIAYPDGAIFSRAGERKQEEARYRAQARDLEMKVADMLREGDRDKKPDMAQISTAQAVISQLKDARAVGRITVEADPGVLAADPELNILLEAGDKIFIPRRPLTVRVGGEVLSPASLQFRRGKTPQNYIEEAGGTTYHADKDRSFVVYPDGSARPLAISAWKQGVTMIPPGSTIIVPRDPKPFNFLESAETISTILANIALTGFYIDDLGDD